MNEEFNANNLNQLAGVLQKSRAIMEQTKNLPRNTHAPQSSYDDYEGNSSYTINEDSGFHTNNTNDAFNFSESSVINSKLPKEVLEVMMESKKERNAMAIASGNELDPSLIEQVNGGRKKQRITEQQTVKPQPAVSTTAVDYSLIKTIIDESVKKHISSLRKSMLNENKGSSLELMTQQGNTFKFVTTDGKIFEGKLTYKGKLEK